jgi:peptidoglycan-N-acetylglucosamine deacetylase
MVPFFHYISKPCCLKGISSMCENSWLHRKIFVFITIFMMVLCTLLPFHSLYSHEQVCKQEDLDESDDIIWSVPTDQKVIAFTFDDGPMPKYLPQILEILKQHNVKATFFFIGSNVVKHPELAKLALVQGHELGNHTFRHRKPTKLSSLELQQEIEKTQKAIFSATGYTTTLFRSPMGKYNDSTLKTVKRTGHRMVLWTDELDTRDWKRPGVSKIVNTVVTRASNGEIVLFHDIVPQTVEAIKIIIPRLKEQGFRFVTISELIQLKKPASEEKNSTP